MSQDQPRRDQNQQQQQGGSIKYGDVFPVSGNLAGQTVSPRDAAMMQTAENVVLGQPQKGGPAATMQSVASKNEYAGVVGHDQSTDVSMEKGVTITETFVPGGRIVTEFVAGQVIGQHISPGPGDAGTADPGRSNINAGENQGGSSVNNENVEPLKITIGDALEAARITAYDKPVEQSDVAAIQAAEARAIGLNVTMPGGVAAQAQSAADANLWVTRDEDKVKLGEVLTDAATKLPADRPVERDDAARVVEAEIRNKEDAMTATGGVGATMAAAARLNERTS